MARDYTVRGRIIADDKASPVVRKTEGVFSRFTDFLRRRVIGAFRDVDRASRDTSKGIVDSGRGLRDAQGAFSSFTNFLRTNVVVTFGEIARVARSALDTIFDAARLRAQTDALRAQLQQQGQDFDAFLGKLNQVAAGTVSTANLIRASSQALLLGIPAQQIAELLEIARASAVATGTDVAQAFQDIATGIGRASPLILDNLGITIKLGEANDRFAQSLGKTAAQLTETEKKQALLNEVLRVGRERVELFGDALNTEATILQQLVAIFANARDSILSGLAPAFLSLAEVAVKVGDGLAILGAAAARVVEFSASLQKNIPGLRGVMTAIEQSARQAREGFNEFAGAMNRVDNQIDVLQARIDLQRRRLEQFGNQAEQTAAQTGGLAQSMIDVGQVFQDLGVTLETDLTAKLEENRAKLAQVEELFRSGRISVSDYQRAKAALVEEARKLNAELEGEIVAIDEATGGLGEYATATIGAANANTALANTARVAAASEDALRGSLRASADQAFLTARAFDALRATQGVGPAVDAALAAGGTLSNFGTRINLPGGGSRLANPGSGFAAGPVTRTTGGGGSFTLPSGAKVMSGSFAPFGFGRSL